MTPFQQVRLWARRAPAGERVTAAVGAALVLAVLCWLLVPAHQRGAVAVGTGGGPAAGTAGPGTGGPDPGGQAGAGVATAEGNQTGGGSGGAAAAGSKSTGASGSGPAAGSGPVSGSGTSVGSGPVSSGSGSATAGPSASGPQAGAGTAGCKSPPGSDQGVTPTEIKIAIIVLNIVGPAANSSFGMEPPSGQQATYQAAVDAVNASGGVACRKLVPVYFTADPVDTSNLQQTCIDVIQSQPFFVIDYGAYYTYPSIATCYPQAHIPFYSSALLPIAEEQHFYPYLFGKASAEMLYRDTVLALAQRGFFAAANGFHKLGVIYEDCTPQLYGEVSGYLAKAGIGSSQIVSYDVGCPTGFTSPNVLEQAILKFKTSGVTNMTEIADEGDFANFTTIAQQQGFRPKYGLPDDGVVPIATGTQKPDYQNIANAIAITADRFGEENTPGIRPNPATVECGSIMTAHGLPTPYRSPDATSGQACDNLWMLRAAIDHAPSLQRSEIAAGLAAAGSVDYSYAYGPNRFGPGVTVGGEAWRVDQFMPSCNCWQVVDQTFHPPFQ